MPVTRRLIGVAMAFALPEDDREPLLVYGIAPGGEGPRSYVDDQRAYSVNEPAIDYHPPLAFVTGWLACGEAF